MRILEGGQGVGIREQTAAANADDIGASDLSGGVVEAMREEIVWIRVEMSPQSREFSF